MKWAAVAVAASLCALAGWRITGLIKADAAVDDDDAAVALAARADDPRALILKAEGQLAGKDLRGATATARQVLQRSPVDGYAYRILGQVAQAEGDIARARALFQVAARRAPRDPPARAWLAQDALQRGDYADAMRHIDAVLTMSPGASGSTMPVLVKLAEDPDFATALAESLQGGPVWRPALLAALAAPNTGSTVANDLVLAALQRAGGLTPTETAAWLDSLIRQGRWGEAYAWWAGPIIQRGDPLPLLFNADWSHEPSGIGFDWKAGSVTGLILAFEETAGVAGRSAHLKFLGRRVSGSFLSHALVLAPGRYRLRWRERADALQADIGVQWRISCAGSGVPLASSEPATGTFSWRNRELEFDAPSTGCQGQWLELGPAGAAGAGQVMSGDLWMAGLALTKV